MTPDLFEFHGDRVYRLDSDVPYAMFPDNPAAAREYVIWRNRQAANAADCLACLDRVRDIMFIHEDHLEVLTQTSRFMTCVECGNKRCPKATNHEHDCTQSNEPGQPGSVYQ